MSFDGSYYWVFANITASLDKDGKIVGYYSVRRQPNPKALEVIKPLYEKLLEKEKSGGMEESFAFLQEFLNERGYDYDNFTNLIQ